VVAALQDTEKDGNRYDLCILDTHLPEVDGCELARLIRAMRPPHSGLPLLAISPPLPGNARTCEAAGFDGFLAKPIRRDKLFQMVEKLFGITPERRGSFSESERRILTQYSVREERKRSVRILLAEDNLVNQKLAQLMLSKAGYQVEIAGNGREAFEKYASEPSAYDLILMDVQMPVMDGFHATRSIRAWEMESDLKPRGARQTSGQVAHAPRRIPIIAVTANARQQDQNACLAAGMNDYISKPIKREIIFEVIAKWVF
jgi:CheY-like chemotaxis protein